ncbi:MAG: glycosyltransferase [Mucilaginibacter sp.]|nr:glycosyltransferase [Mucilaginibacter sp.]
MKYVFASYVVTKAFNQPEAWINRTQIYNGILEALSDHNMVSSIEQIDYEGEYVKNGVNYYFMRFSRPVKYFPGQLHRFIKKLQPDVVVIQGLHFPLQVILLRLTLGRKGKIILHHHAERPFTGIKKYIQRIADRYVDAYLFASRELGMDWIKKGNLSSPQKIHEVMEVSSVFYPVDKAFAILKTGVTGNPIFLWVGRLNANKDPLTVVRAFLQFVTACPNAVLYMIYQTIELLNDIITLLKNHPYKERIVLIGEVVNDDLLYWYNSADFILSGSHYEGSGTAICEAMSCGCVPVITDIFSFRMMTNKGKCGILYEAGNETALLAALMQTQLMNIAEQRAMSLAYFKSNLSFEAIARKVQEIAINL